MRAQWTICAAILGGAATLLLADPAEAASVGKCGGGGAQHIKTLSCPAGQYVVGLFARGNPIGYVDRVGISCASFNASGVRGTPGQFQIAGGSGGSSSRTQTCEGNRAVTSIAVSAGSYVDKVNYIFCLKRQAPGGFGQSGDILDLKVGGIGGGFCVVDCPDGEAMHKLIVRYGSWIDSIEGFCRP
jgi:hypothetical protein